MKKKILHSLSDRQKRTVEVCNLFELSFVSEYNHLPDRLKLMFSMWSYKEIVKPLIRIDHFQKGYSIRRLAQKYKVGTKTVRYAVKECEI